MRVGPALSQGQGPCHAEWPTKRDRAELLLVALASLLVRGGERLTLLGSAIAPMNGRIALSRVVEMIGRDPEVEGLVWVAALGGHGMTTSPAVGRLGATAVLGGTSEELQSFSPGRLSK